MKIGILSMQARITPAITASILRTARGAIEARLRHEEEAPPELVAELVDAPEVSGVFVTVHVHGALRGCIGFLALQGSLAATIAEAARRAAAHDTRFAPVTRDEREAMTVEVTLLAPLERIADPDDFEIGVHGLVLEYLGRRGLLLPQVAVDQGWDRQQFLSGVCRKAMLPDRSWEHPDATLSRFEGLVLRETESHATPAPERRTD